ncbi:ABC transporter permease [Streptomyces halobius]|uniref:Transport permease protein n=1 Tax=Streptomyces halobius TaxID=2879846 RepID=A0ABY4MBH4_9ACTN|nr:ABC transporter permease [Streptomyces halobius]UQA95134.1 ABC transporter permease [Streptomyces halobius]
MPQPLAPPAPAPAPATRAVPVPVTAPDPTLRALAARHGLTVSGARPSLPAYTRQLWARRHFIASFATARLTAQYASAKLGQIWQIATPLLNAGVYYLIFGVLLHTSRGIPDFIPFLCTGIFVFTFTQSAVMAGTRAISGNLGLVRALHFPRACLPIAFTLIQLQQLLLSMGVLAAIVLACGVPLTWHWLLMIPALLLQSVFNTGLALIMARIGARTTDTAQLMPFVLRTWMYTSGVFYNLSAFTKDAPHLIAVTLDCNPTLIYIDLIRYALIDTVRAGSLPPHVWPLALTWAVLIGVGGYVYFWKAEEEYGRG